MIRRGLRFGFRLLLLAASACLIYWGHKGGVLANGGLEIPTHYAGYFLLGGAVLG